MIAIERSGSNEIAEVKFIQAKALDYATEVSISHSSGASAHCQSFLTQSKLLDTLRAFFIEL